MKDASGRPPAGSRVEAYLPAPSQRAEGALGGTDALSMKGSSRALKVRRKSRELHLLDATRRLSPWDCQPHLELRTGVTGGIPQAGHEEGDNQGGGCREEVCPQGTAQAVEEEAGAGDQGDGDRTWRSHRSRQGLHGGAQAQAGGPHAHLSNLPELNKREPGHDGGTSKHSRTF